MFAGALALQDGNLKSVEFPTDAGRAHRMAQHLQALAQVLQATEGHVADGDMGLYPPRRPVIDGSDFQVMLVGAEAGFDQPELVILGDGRLGCEIVPAMNDDGVQPVPLGFEPPLVYRSQKSTETRRMTNGNSGNRFTPEIRARAVCLVLENEADYTSRTQAVLSIAKKIGCNGDTLRVWVRNHEIEIGLRNGVTQAERDELKILQRENKELRQANDILRKASAFFAAAELDRLRKK